MSGATRAYLNSSAVIDGKAFVLASSSVSLSLALSCSQCWQTDSFVALQALRKAATELGSVASLPIMRLTTLSGRELQRSEPRHLQAGRKGLTLGCVLFGMTFSSVGEHSRQCEDSRQPSYKPFKLHRPNRVLR